MNEENEINEKLEFRVFTSKDDKKEKEMIYFDFYSIDTGILLNGVFKCLDKLDVMMFAGLKDMNGKKFFRGDIFRPEGHTDYCNVLIFKYGCFGYMVGKYHFVELGRNHHYFKLTEDSHQSHVLEIIGNIYEHPELLKKGDQIE